MQLFPSRTMLSHWLCNILWEYIEEQRVAWSDTSQLFDSINYVGAIVYLLQGMQLDFKIEIAISWNCTYPIFVQGEIQGLHISRAVGSRGCQSSSLFDTCISNYCDPNVLGFSKRQNARNFQTSNTARGRSHCRRAKIRLPTTCLKFTVQVTQISKRFSATDPSRKL